MQYSTVYCYNEELIRNITDIPTIYAEQSVDRYMLGWKNYIVTEICKIDYSKVNKMMSDALKVDYSKGKHVANNFPNTKSANVIPKSSGAVPLDR